MAKDERFVKGTNMLLSNCKVKWAYLREPDTKFNEKKWAIDVYPSLTDAKELMSLGFNMKDSDDGPFLKLKRKCVTATGKKLNPPIVVGKDPKIPFEGEIGNGSICNIMVFAIYRNVNGKDYLCSYLEGVQVVDLVERNSGASFESIE